MACSLNVLPTSKKHYFEIAHEILLLVASTSTGKPFTTARGITHLSTTEKKDITTETFTVEITIDLQIVTDNCHRFKVFIALLDLMNPNDILNIVFSLQLRFFKTSENIAVTKYSRHVLIFEF